MERKAKSYTKVNKPKITHIIECEKPANVRKSKFIQWLAAKHIHPILSMPFNSIHFRLKRD